MRRDCEPIEAERRFQPHALMLFSATSKMPFSVHACVPCIAMKDLIPTKLSSRQTPATPRDNMQCKEVPVNHCEKHTAVKAEAGNTIINSKIYRAHVKAAAMGLHITLIKR